MVLNSERQTKASCTNMFLLNPDGYATKHWQLQGVTLTTVTTLQPHITNKQTKEPPWPESVSKLYQPSDPHCR